MVYASIVHRRARLKISLKRRGQREVARCDIGVALFPLRCRRRPDILLHYSLRPPPPDLRDLVNRRTCQRPVYQPSYAKGVHSEVVGHSRRSRMPLQRRRHALHRHRH